MKALYPNSIVYGVEHIKQLAIRSKKSIKKYNKMYDIENIHIFYGDGRRGLKNNMPFDFIHCGAG